MDNFDKILKEKVEQFEVPYNDAHWAEMEGKLNQIRATKIKNTILSLAAGLVTLGVAGYMIFSFPDNTTNELTEETTNNIENLVNTTSEKHINVSNNSSNVEYVSNENHSTNIIDKEHKLITENNLDENANNIKAIKIEPSNISDKDEVVDNKIQNATNNTQETKTISADFIVYNNKVCVGEEVSFESMDNEAQVSYLWNFGDDKISHKTNPVHIYENAGIYNVTLTLIDKLTGKEYTKIQRDVVHILPQPDTYFTYTEESKKHDDNKLSYPYTFFNIKDAEKGTTYKWDFGNNQTSLSDNPKTIYNKADEYVVTLIAENSFGCVNSTQKRVAIKKDIDLYAPNTLLPNSNIPENKVFIHGALLGWDVLFEMSITDKSGKLLYKTSDKNEPWNGKMNNTGQLLNDGIYFWNVIVTDAYGVKHSYQGSFQLKQ